MKPEYSAALGDAYKFFREKGASVNFILDFERGEDFDLFVVYDEESFPSEMSEKDREVAYLLEEIKKEEKGYSSVYFSEGNRAEYRLSFENGTLSIALTSKIEEEDFIEIEEIGSASGL